MGQIRQIPFTDQAIGQGFNTLTGEALGMPFDVPGTAAIGADGQTGQVFVNIVTTHEELTNSLGLGISESAHYGLFSESGKFQLAQNSSYNSTSTFIVASQIVQNAPVRGTSFNLVPAATDLLNKQQMDQFHLAYGDSFVRARQDGGEFYAVLQITSVNSETQSQLSASLQADVEGLFAGGHFDAQFSEANKHVETKSSFSAWVYQRGGQGDELAPTFSAADVINRLKSFPASAQTHPVTYEVEVAAYETAPLPVPTPQQQEARLETLQDCVRQKLMYETFRNDIEFAMKPDNAIYFVSRPDPATMATKRDLFVRVIGAILQHAAKVSTAEAPATFFTSTDPAMCNPPIAAADLAPLTLTRAPNRTPPPSVVTMPNLVGSTSQDWDGDGLFIRGLTYHFIVTQVQTLAEIGPEGDNAVDHECISQQPAPGATIPWGSVVTVNCLNRDPPVGATTDLNKA